MEIGKLMGEALQKLENLNQVNSTVLQKQSKCSKCKISLPYRRDWKDLCEDHSYEYLVSVKEQMRNHITNEMQMTGLPDKFCREDFNQIDWVKNYPSEKGLFLTGGVGIGKTVSMALIVRGHFEKMCGLSSRYLCFPGKTYSAGLEIDRHVPVWRFISFPAFIMEIQDSYKKEGESALDSLKEVAEVPFLIIDDLGAEKMTDYVRQATYYIINEREMRERDTFITSNFTLDELNHHIDARVASRIAGMCDIKSLRNNVDQRIKR